MIDKRSSNKKPYYSQTKHVGITMIEAVEVFCGIGGFRIASDNLNIKTIWANDIDESACAVYSSRFGTNEIVCGDIREFYNKIPEHDLLTAGFPCQPFSSAGDKKGIKDPRGTLFKYISDILKRNRPKYFVLENVKRLLTMQSGMHFATILNELSTLEYFVEWRVVRACDFGLPQHRERVFIIGTRNDMIDKNCCIKLLNDEEAHEVVKKGYYSYLINMDKWISIENHGKKFKNWGVATNEKFIDANVSTFSEKIPCSNFKSILQEEVDPSFDFTEKTLERIKESNYANKYYNGVQILYNQGGGARMGYTIFGTNGIAPTLTATPSRHYERYKINGRFRRLTNIEYARLQGFPDNHCDMISIYNQYALYGNAVPPPMAEWVIKKVISNTSTQIKPPPQRRMSLLSDL